MANPDEMKQVKRMSASLSHDLNNYSGAIQGYTELLKLELPPGDECHFYLDRIVEACQRVVGRSSMLDNFAGNASCRGAQCDAIALTRKSAETANLPFELETPQDEAQEWVEGDPGLIAKAIDELLRNAREACAGREQAAEIQILARVHPDEFEICVSDNGPGIPQAEQEQIFYPYVSGKGKGRGFGLSWVHGWIARCGGRIVVESQEGQGTRMRILLRRVASQTPASSLLDPISKVS